MIYTIILKTVDDNGSETINGVLSFDCIKSFNESRSATVSTQTVEKGFNISDNINIEPTQFSLDGFISSYYIKDDDNEIVYSEGKFQTKNQNNQSYNHARIRDSLITFFEERNVFTLMESEYASSNKDVTESYNESKRGYYKEHENCVLIGMDFSIPEASSEVFSISMKIQKITIAVVQERELQAGEMGVLQKYKPDTNVSSVSNTSTNGGGDSGDSGDSDDDVAGKPDDVSNVLKDAEKNAKKPQTVTDISGGQTWDSGYSVYKPTIESLRSGNEALKRQIQEENAKHGY